MSATSVPLVILRLPVLAPVAVVVPNVNLSALSSQINAALLPVLPRSNINPKSLLLLLAPVFSSIRPSSITLFVVLIVVVVPLTVRLPVTVASCDTVRLGIVTASASPIVTVPELSATVVSFATLLNVIVPPRLIAVLLPPCLATVILLFVSELFPMLLSVFELPLIVLLVSVFVVAAK